MPPLDALSALALNAFSLFVQFVIAVLDFFLVLARIILTALHLQ